MELSVVIPMHDAAATVGRVLGSLRAQRLADWEAIVVDDGSTDAGRGSAVVAALAREDDRIRLIRQPNGGVSRARNTGLDAATGRFVLLLDADDWMLPGGVDALVEAAREGGGGGAVGTFEMVSVGPDGTERVLSTEGPWSEEIGLHHLLGGIFMTTHGHVVERRFYEEPARLRFDPEVPLIEDTDLWIRLAERGVRWRNCGRPVGGYLMRPDSRSVRFGAMLEWTVRVYAGAYERAAALAREGRLPAGIDVSRERLARLLGHAALGYATRLAISAEGRIEDAAALVRGTPAIVQSDAARLARAARHAVMFALGREPRVESDEAGAWWPRLRGWWDRCEAEGWLPVGGAVEAAREFEGVSGGQRPCGAAACSGAVGGSRGGCASQTGEAAQPAPVFGR